MCTRESGKKAEAEAEPHFDNRLASPNLQFQYVLVEIDTVFEGQKVGWKVL